MAPKLGEYYRAIEPIIDQKLTDLRKRREDVNVQLGQLQQEYKMIGDTISRLQKLSAPAQSIEVPIDDNQPVSAIDFVHVVAEQDVFNPTEQHKKVASEVIIFARTLSEIGIDPYKKAVVKKEQPSTEIPKDKPKDPNAEALSFGDRTIELNPTQKSVLHYLHSKGGNSVYLGDIARNADVERNQVREIVNQLTHILGEDLRGITYIESSKGRAGIRLRFGTPEVQNLSFNAIGQTTPPKPSLQ